jgi:capsular exopolysaccharide synthesis family protein
MPIGLASLWRAIKRYSLLVFVFALLAAAAGVLVYFFLPLPKMTGRIIYLVNTNPTGVLNPNVWNDRDPTNFRNYQVNGITSRLVLNAAMSEPGMANLSFLEKDRSIDGVQYFQSNLKIDFNTGMEHMRVSLEGDSQEELLVALKAINLSYMRWVYEKEMVRRNEKLVKLQKLLEDQNSKIKNSSLKIQNALALGSADEFLLVHERGHISNLINSADTELDGLNRRRRDLQMLLTRIEGNLKLPRNMRTPIDREFVKGLVENDLNVIAQLKKLAGLEAEIRRYDEALKAGSPKPPMLLLLETQKTEATAKLNELRRDLPRAIEQQLQKDLDKNEKQVVENIDQQIKGIDEQKQAVVKEMKDAQQKLNDLNAAATSVEPMMLEKKNAEQISSRVNNELVTMVTEMGDLSRVSLWEDAYVFPGIEGNRRVKYTAMTVAGFLILGLALAQWLEIRHRRIQTLDEVTGGLGLTVIGTVPAMPKGGAAARSNWPHLLTEAVNTTRTMLLSGPGAGETKTLLITSAMSGEGKTSLTTHLAVSLAAAGRRVLLIDADMRRPAVHKVLGLESKPGLAELLTGTAMLAEVTQTTKVAGLHLVPAGTYTREAAAMLSTERWSNILKESAVGYDFVLVDSPPILPVADALAIARNVDGVLISVMQDLSRYGAVQTACQRLSMVGAKVLGVVVSGVTTQGGYYYYYYDERYSKPNGNAVSAAPAVTVEPPATA